MGMVPPCLLLSMGVVSIGEVRKMDLPPMGGVTMQEAADALRAMFAPMPPLAEDMPYFKDATNRPVSIPWGRLMKCRSEWEGSVRDGFIYDGYGGRISVEDMTPIWQIGKPEPTGYMDRSGNFYLVEDRPLAGQYEDAAVDYERC